MTVFDLLLVMSDSRHLIYYHPEDGKVLVQTDESGYPPYGEGVMRITYIVSRDGSVQCVSKEPIYRTVR